MKAWLLSGFVIALLTGGAFAQANGQPPPSAPGMAAPPPSAPGLAPPPPPPFGESPPSVSPDAEADDMDGLRRRRLPVAPVLEVSAPLPERAAHFRLQRGDALIDVKCADEEPMKACAELALQMVDRLQAPTRP